MKKNNIVFKITGIVLIYSLLLTCTKEQENYKSEIDFKLGISVPSNNSNFKNAPVYYLKQVKNIVLTITNSDGTATKYTSSEIKILEMNGSYYTQKLVLKAGNYKITNFGLVDSSGNTIFAAPASGSQQAQNVTSPLPMLFSISKNITTPVNVEVLNTALHTPDEFGLSHFPISDVATISFLIGVIDKETGKFLPAKLTVSGGSYSYVQNLDSVANNAVTVKDGLTDYMLTIEKTGYQKYSQNFSHDSLSLFIDVADNLPILINLEKTGVPTISDCDGNTYKTVTIGPQTWMAENLRTTKYNDGTEIPLVTDNNTWANMSTAAYCWYNNDPNTYKYSYGALYNWYTVNTNKLCPTGWHVPTENEWDELINYLGGIQVAGSKLKESGTAHWFAPNSGATNESGFSALPSGERPDWNGGVFIRSGENGIWWTSTFNMNVGWFKMLFYDNPTVFRGLGIKEGWAVRCMKD